MYTLSMGGTRFIILLAILAIYYGWDCMKSNKRLKFCLTSTEGHNELFMSRKAAEAYIRQLHKDKKVGAFVEFRIYKVGEK